MNKYVMVILALLMMQEVATANASDVVPYVSIGGGQVVTEYVENGPSGGVSMKKSTWALMSRRALISINTPALKCAAALRAKFNMISLPVRWAAFRR